MGSDRDRADHVYMLGLARPRTPQRQLLRQYGPYAVITVVIGLMFWWAQGVKQDLQHDRAALMIPVQPSRSNAPTAYAPEDSAPSKDWTHQIVVRPTRHDSPDDDTAVACPTPRGNWAHTCRADILIEGPCSKKCLLTAVCLDVHNKMQNTTFEYPEAEVLEVKNINGLLCRLRSDGSVACGLNFHGNIARKNCAGYIPRRRETLPGGLDGPQPISEFAPPRRAYEAREAHEVHNCGPPLSHKGMDFQHCTDYTHGGFCSVKCAAGYVGLPTATCTPSGWVIEGSCSEAPRDWTHKLSLKRHDLDAEPDDHNEKSCPTPYGNWQHTCVEDIVVEGPCGGKCLVQARCNNLAGDLQDATLEFREGERFEVKNVNGLLCRAEGDVPVCGLNFHGNLALKNCARGNVPHRHEKMAGALPAPAPAYTGRSEKDSGTVDVDNEPGEQWRSNGRRSRSEEPERRATKWGAEGEEGAARYRRQYAPVKWGRGDGMDGTEGQRRRFYRGPREDL